MRCSAIQHLKTSGGRCFGDIGETDAGGALESNRSRHWAANAAAFGICELEAIGKEIWCSGIYRLETSGWQMASGALESSSLRQSRSRFGAPESSGSRSGIYRLEIWNLAARDLESSSSRSRIYRLEIWNLAAQDLESSSSTQAERDSSTCKDQIRMVEIRG
jgi:hypothetical protein